MTHHPSFGTILAFDPTGGTTYVDIAYVHDISGPNITRGDVDVTNHDSTDGYREFLPGLTDPGDVTFQIGFDPLDADHTQGAGTGLLGDFAFNDGCDPTNWEITLNVCAGTAVWTFEGYVNSWSGVYAVEGELLADIGVKVAGKPTLTVTT